MLGIHKGQTRQNIDKGDNKWQIPSLPPITHSHMGLNPGINWSFKNRTSSLLLWTKDWVLKHFGQKSGEHSSNTQTAIAIDSSASNRRPENPPEDPAPSKLQIMAYALLDVSFGNVDSSQRKELAVFDSRNLDENLDEQHTRNHLAIQDHESPVRRFVSEPTWCS